MSYKYITENNLYNKQTYMYAEYEGKRFLEEYLKSRKIARGMTEFSKQENRIESDSMVYQDLKCIYSDIRKGDRDAVNRIKPYVKTFEVRKRLYTEYLDWKPTEKALFEVYEIYLIFSDCLLEAYKETNCLKYYSCLLKVDDMLLSIYPLLTLWEREHLSAVISEELKIFCTLLEKHGIVLGDKNGTE